MASSPPPKRICCILLIVNSRAEPLLRSIIVVGVRRKIYLQNQPEHLPKLTSGGRSRLRRNLSPSRSIIVVGVRRKIYLQNQPEHLPKLTSGGRSRRRRIFSKSSLNMFSKYKPKPIYWQASQMRHLWHLCLAALLARGVTINKIKKTFFILLIVGPNFYFINSN